MNAVRLGNVIGSPGSVVPVFREQIAAGGPVTVTHPEVRRWFMTVDQAVDAILGAAESDCEIVAPDLGESARILELAEFLIREAGSDAAIAFTGLRAGDKLVEQMVSSTQTPRPSLADVESGIARLRSLAAANDVPGLMREAAVLVPEYVPSELVR